MIKKILAIFLLVVTTQVLAHSDYSQELFTYTNSTGDEITVEKYFTDGIIAADPVKLRVLKKDKKTVVYEGEWTAIVQSFQESDNRWVVFEYEEITTPPRVTIFENGEFHEGEANLYSYIKSIIEHIIGVLPVALFFVMLFLLSQGLVAHKIVVSVFFAVFVLMIGTLTLPLTFLVAYLLVKVVLNKLSISIDRQKRAIKYIFLAGLIYVLYEIGLDLLDITTALFWES